MNTFISKFFAILFFGMLLSTDSIAQETTSNGVWYDVKRVYPTPTVKRDTLTEAKTIKDINRYYKPIWVREFISVEVIAVIDGVSKVAKGKSDVLTKEQKYIMDMADPKSEIYVNMKYMPENTLKVNEPKTFDFSFHVDADKEACYSEGRDPLLEYLGAKAISNIDNELFDGKYNLAAVKFAIDEHGQVVNAHVFATSDDKHVDSMLLETVCNMPSWKAAEYTNGLKAQQEFVLTVGNKESCTMNSLYLR